MSPRATWPAGVSRGDRVLWRICRAIAVGVSTTVFPGPVVGLDNLPAEGAYVIAPVHRSNLDFLIVARLTRRRIRYLAKAEVWRMRRLGAFIEHLGALPVHRESTDRESFNRSLAALESGEPLVLFPEGTRREGPEVGEIHEGAAYLALRAGVPIVPIGLGGTVRAMPRGAILPRPARVRVVVAPPIATLRSEGSGRVPRSRVHAVTEELRAAIQSATADAEALLELSRRRRVASLGRRRGTANPGAPISEHPATDRE